MSNFLIIFFIIFGSFIVVLLGFCLGDSAYQKNKTEKLVNLKKELNVSYFYFRNGTLSIRKQDPRIDEFILLKAYNPSLSSTTPTKVVYTGATVGSVSTGGFHTVGGETVTSKIKTHRFEMLWYDIVGDEGEETWELKPIEKICLSDKLILKAQNCDIGDYLNGNEIIIKEDDEYTYADYILMQSGNTQAMSNNITMRNIDKYPSMTKCKAIMDFICGFDETTQQENSNDKKESLEKDVSTKTQIKEGDWECPNCHCICDERVKKCICGYKNK